MSEKEEFFLAKSRVQQFIAHFACRVPIRKELAAGEKKALENVLRDLDPEVFQLCEEPLQKNPLCLFQVLRQLPVGATSITLPSFIFSNDSFSFILPIKMFGNRISGIISVDTKDMNSKILSWIIKIQETINNLHCQRTGKIYEIVLGPFTQEDKSQIFKELLSVSLSDVGELNLTFANYHKDGTDIFNIQNNIHYLQGNLEEQFFINMRIDINNRILSTSMEPPQIEKVWKFADSVIDAHLKRMLII